MISCGDRDQPALLRHGVNNTSFTSLWQCPQPNWTGCCYSGLQPLKRQSQQKLSAFAVCGSFLNPSQQTVWEQSHLSPHCLPLHTL